MQPSKSDKDTGYFHGYKSFYDKNNSVASVQCCFKSYTHGGHNVEFVFVMSEVLNIESLSR